MSDAEGISLTEFKLSYPPKVLVTKIGLDGHDRGARSRRPVMAAGEGATHGEIVRTLRDVLGFGQPLVQI